MSSTRKVAIVTGAGTGIGKSAALALLKDGYCVALVGRRKELLDKTAADSGAAERTLSLPADLAMPANIGPVFAAVKAKWGRLDVLFNNAGMGAPAIPMEDLTLDQWQNVVEHQPHRDVPLHPGGDPHHEGADPAWAGASSTTARSRRTRRARSPRPTPRPSTRSPASPSATSLDCRKYDIACSQIDIGNAATEMTERMKNGVPQANGTTMVEPRMDVAHVGSAVAYMASLPLDANVQFMTIMATKMPFVGRG